MSLLLAVFEEHRQRTGHDFSRRDDKRVWGCTVCNALYAEHRREESEECRANDDATASAAPAANGAADGAAQKGVAR